MTETRSVSVIRIVLSVLIWTILFPGRAQALGGESAGTSAAPFLKIGPGARPAAMGEAFSAVEGDAHSIYYNPAGLAGIESWQFTGMHDRYLDGLSYNFLGAAVPVRRLLRLEDPPAQPAALDAANVDTSTGSAQAAGPRRAAAAAAGVLAFAVYSLSADDIERRGRADTDAPTGTFGSDDVAVALAYARPFGDRWQGGGSLKFIRQSLDDRTAAAVAVDGGALYRLDQRWTLSGGLRHLGTKPNLGGTASPLPVTGYLGAAHRPAPGVILSADLGLPGDNDPSLGLGAEYSRTFLAGRSPAVPALAGDTGVAGQDSLRGAFRLGYLTRHADADATGLAFGFGAGHGRFDFDFAWVPMGELGQTLRFSIKLGF